MHAIVQSPIRGADPRTLTKTAATIYGSTETTFYVIAVYFGAVSVKKIRHALPVGLLADFTSILLSIYLVKILF